ncbi:uncharacterized protein LOC128385762 [Panonychus citri]|uniref:uncharacterized protein LOC128385762 n=1 Tax=Panonychus citri TaxID=50023 RepID=UPI002306F49D|nr:uncharacterized protein LOC128385762 [Panonychus citri]
MKLIVLILEISLSIIYCDAWLGDQTMDSGDIIICKSTNWIIDVFKYHTLIASGHDKLVHVIGHKNKAQIVEETVKQYLDRNMEKNCHNNGPGSKGRVRTVQDAYSSLEKFKGQSVYYNLLTCNCQHWVEYWANGQAWSPSSKQYGGKKCQAPTSGSKNLLKALFNF